jgi:TrpR-related protein YerC/YecD
VEGEMAKRVHDKNKEDLFKAILSLKTVEECYDFFEDLCTITEIKDMSQRMHVAKMLSQGIVYSEIVTETGASTATISRVNRSLEYGNDGYKLIFDRMEK